MKTVSEVTRVISINFTAILDDDKEDIEIIPLEESVSRLITVLRSWNIADDISLSYAKDFILDKKPEG